jgi:hypothetical protein
LRCFGGEKYGKVEKNDGEDKEFINIQGRYVMQGMEFRAIRMFNRVKQLDLAYNVGLTNRHSIQKLERMKAVPPKYVRALSDMIGLNLLDKKLFQEHYQEIPDSYKKINYTEQPPGYAGYIIQVPKSIYMQWSEKEREHYAKWKVKIEIV